ncbi:MAG: N-6 DNA methylase [Gemmataceae bacterium]|nr:N-6 DNA methylase [Gemmataceae bacterium]
MQDEPDSGLLAPSDIADLAGVSRAAVSNWRRRESEFPEPVGGTKANPLFNREEVENWLKARPPQKRRTQKISAEVAERVAAGLEIWPVMNRFRGEIPITAMATVALSVLCARKLAAGSDRQKTLRHDAQQGRYVQSAESIANAEDADPRWRELVAIDPGQLPSDSLDRLAAELYPVVARMDVEDMANAADYILERLIATEGRTAGEHGAVQSGIAEVLAATATAETPTATIAYDPACGIGEALIRFWEKSPHRDRLHLYGSEKNEEYARICRQRCYLYGATATVESGDVLLKDPVPDLKADAVMAEPPFAMEMPPGFSLADSRWALAGLPPKANADTAWIQHVIAHLQSDGRGVVVTALGVTSAPGSAAIRRQLIQQGCIQTVVALPRKLLTHTPVQTALWILRTPNRAEPAESVRFVDASHLDPGRAADLRILQSGNWAQDNPETPTAQVTVEEILPDEQLRLDPRHWTRPAIDPGEIADRYRSAVDALDRAIQSIKTAPAIRTVDATAHISTIRELEKQGVLRIVRRLKTPVHRDDDRGGRNPDDPDATDSWVITRRMIRHGLPRTPHPAPAPGPADEENAGNLTEPGDILVTTGGYVRAVVDETGGWLPGVGVFRLVVDRQHFQPHYVAACLNSSWNQVAETGSTIPAMLRDLEIPLIPLDDQTRLVTQITHARDIADTGRRLTEAADQITAAQLDAIRHDVHL